MRNTTTTTKKYTPPILNIFSFIYEAHRSCHQCKQTVFTIPQLSQHPLAKFFSFIKFLLQYDIDNHRHFIFFFFLNILLNSHWARLFIHLKYFSRECMTYMLTLKCSWHLKFIYIENAFICVFLLLCSKEVNKL